MAKIAYIKKTFRQATEDLIAKANEIIDSYAADGYDLTIRQLYYQFVARGILENRQRNYKRLVDTINNARLAGLVDWERIVDRTRTMRGNSHWDSPKDIISACASQFRLDTRLTQDTYIEVWIEKDALVGVLEGVCTELDVPYFSCRGYTSQSAVWRAANRVKSMAAGRVGRAVIIHLGDHDPSGIDMTRDIQTRLEIFGCSAHVDRIALNMDQVTEYSPPPNPAKITDSRYDAYVEEYGEESWELDALDPRSIYELIRQTISQYTNNSRRQALIDDQWNNRRQLRGVATNWDQIIDQL